MVLDTALALFRERGFEETTIRDIASRAGLSLGAAYYYFKSKEALVAAYYGFVQREHPVKTIFTFPSFFAAACALPFTPRSTSCEMTGNYCGRCLGMAAIRTILCPGSVDRHTNSGG